MFVRATNAKKSTSKKVKRDNLWSSGKPNRFHPTATHRTRKAYVALMLFNKVLSSHAWENSTIVFSHVGKAKNLVEMWKTIDKENTPPPERRGQRAFTPPTDNERRMSPPTDVRMTISANDHSSDWYLSGRVPFSHIGLCRRQGND